jgi:hypothetical protein
MNKKMNKMRRILRFICNIWGFWAFTIERGYEEPLGKIGVNPRKERKYFEHIR